jgi:hypothetical protein
LLAPVQPGGQSAASPFLGKCSDNNNWWIKPPVVGMKRALVAEWTAGKLGSVIGAPVCEVALVDIPAQLLPYEYGPGKQLVAGTGCASCDLGGTPHEVKTTLQYRDADDNGRRHAGVFAIVDWFYGNDVQWLHDTADDWTLHSHDHGWYLPPGGPDWTVDQLRATVATPQQPLGDPAGLDVDELNRLASAIDAVTDDQIVEVLSAVPPQWDVAPSDLECLAWYLAERRTSVAARLRSLRPTEKTA